ncbi:acid phosphatase [Maridesulfovibrio frigidus]|uniref:acid phosphatase n=1 Tax=Maridesulfovibrio frigidus TaxID=340956 RepID=UPI0012EC0122|nr:phosphatase PAP2 family protein [Maridesulfovibrio frigidus]
MIKSIVFPVFLVILIGGGCIKKNPPNNVPEIRSGILQGYLSKDEYPDSLALLPPPPDVGSAGFAMDQAISNEALKFQGTARFELARKDADLMFPALAETFSCALGIPITEELTPHLYMLMRRSLADAGLSSYAGKDYYQRQRPFMVNDQPTCTPEEEEHLSGDGSYPSGHTAVGWAMALILTQVAPERTDAILKRGREFGESRIICNVHWYSDVLAGRMVGAAAVARLNSNAEFMAAIESARVEVAKVKDTGMAFPDNCQKEKDAFKQSLSLQ